MGVFLAPCAEEVLFRGVVYPGLRNALGPWLAVALSAVLFGLAALPVVFTLLRTRKPELGVPQLALSIRRSLVPANR